MNTVQRSLAMGDPLPIALDWYSSSGQESLWACSSMKLPVPEAHTVFMAQKVTAPSLRVVNLESWPPISMMVSTAGLISLAARAWAVISSITRSAPIMAPMSFLPAPVVAAPRNVRVTPAARAISSTAAKTARTASTGLPEVLV
jgi:hypothetical protein